MITEVLKTGAENAQTGQVLCNRLNIGRRELTQRIRKERRSGSPICASVHKPYGYFLAANKEEMQGYCRSLRSRAGEIFKTRGECLKTIDKLPAVNE